MKEKLFHVSNFPIEEKEDLKELIFKNHLNVKIGKPEGNPEPPIGHMVGVYAPTIKDLEEFWMFYDVENNITPGGIEP